MIAGFYIQNRFDSQQPGHQNNLQLNNVETCALKLTPNNLPLPIYRYLFVSLNFSWLSTSTGSVTYVEPWWVIRIRQGNS